MHNILIGPRKYVQGRNALADAGKYLKILGKKPLLLWDATVKGLVGKTLLDSLAAEKSSRSMSPSRVTALAGRSTA